MNRFMSLMTFATATLFVAGSAKGDPVDGPKYDIRWAAGQTTLTYEESLRAGEETLIQLAGNGASNLDLYIFDQYGNLITGDERSSDEGVVNIYPLEAGVFRIVVVNRGGADNNYVLLIGRDATLPADAHLPPNTQAANPGMGHDYSPAVDSGYGQSAFQADAQNEMNSFSSAVHDAAAYEALRESFQLGNERLIDSMRNPYNDY